MLVIDHIAYEFRHAGLSKSDLIYVLATCYLFSEEI